MIAAALLSLAHGHDLGLARIVFGERPVGAFGLYPEDVQREGHAGLVRPYDRDNISLDLETARFVEEIHATLQTPPAHKLGSASFRNCEEAVISGPWA